VGNDHHLEGGAMHATPPKHLSDAEIRAFFDRLRVLRPDVTLFVMDTALRPLRQSRADARGGVAMTVARRELWALTPPVYAVNSNPDLMRDIGRAIAEGLAMLAPTVP
jgi:hypothetical protein